MIVQILVAFIATISFSALFNVPKEQYAFCGITGAFGWLCYLISTEIYPSTVIASFIAAFVLTCISRIFAVYRKSPVTIFLISGIFPLVPGAGIYNTAYHIIMGDNVLALNTGIHTVKIAVAIALGILFVFSLPQWFFNYFNKRKRSLNKNKNNFYS